MTSPSKATARKRPSSSEGDRSQGGVSLAFYFFIGTLALSLLALLGSLILM